MFKSSLQRICHMIDCILDMNEDLTVFEGTLKYLGINGANQSSKYIQWIFFEIDRAENSMVHCGASREEAARYCASLRNFFWVPNCNQKIPLARGFRGSSGFSGSKALIGPVNRHFPSDAITAEEQKELASILDELEALQAGAIKTDALRDSIEVTIESLRRLLSCHPLLSKRILRAILDAIREQFAGNLVDLESAKEVDSGVWNSYGLAIKKLARFAKYAVAGVALLATTTSDTIDALEKVNEVISGSAKSEISGEK